MKKILTFLLVFGMLFSWAAPVYAQKKGYSSSGSSGSRGYSSSSSSGSRSSSSSGSRSSSSSSTGKPSSSSYSSSSSSGNSKGYSSSSSGNKPSSGGSSSTGNKSPPGYSTNNSSYSKKPTQTFQSLPAAEQKKSEARAAYQKATAPKETYTTKSGETKKIDVNDPKTKQVQDTYTQHPEKWVTRKDRVDATYGNYYNRPPPTTTVVYHDRMDYNPWFWMWLADRSVNDRADWYYHHRSDIDEQRYKDVLAKDAQLEARIKELETKKVPRDPSYVPPGMDADVQYDDDFCDGVFNPEPKPHTSTPVNWGGFFHGLWVVVKWIVGIILVLALIYGVYWLVFEYRW